MLYLVSYEGATPGQDQLIQDVLRQRKAVRVPGNNWIFESMNENVLTALWSVRCGENVRIFIADVSQAHFATSPYSDVRALLRAANKPPAPSGPANKPETSGESPESK